MECPYCKTLRTDILSLSGVLALCHPSWPAHGPQMRMVNVQQLAVICGLPGHIKSFVSSHGVLCLLEYTAADFVLGSVAVRQIMAINWSTPRCALCLPNHREACDALLLKEYVRFAREHGCSAQQVFPVAPNSACGLLMTLEAMR